MNDLVGWNGLNINHCPTDGMVADFMTKNLVDLNVNFFLNLINNLSNKNHHTVQHYSVG